MSSKFNAIANLKKAHAAQAIVKDTFSVKDYHARFHDLETKKAKMIIVAIESKYVSKFDKRDAPAGTEGAGCLGFRTRFFLADGSTVGAFSNGIHRFIEFFANIAGKDPEAHFLHIDFDGSVEVEISIHVLDAKRSTYNMEITGGEFFGMTEYMPTTESILYLDTGESLDTETGELKDSAPEDEPELTPAQIAAKKKADAAEAKKAAAAVK